MKNENEFWERVAEKQKENIAKYRKEKRDAKKKGEPFPSMSYPCWIKKSKKKKEEIVEFKEDENGMPTI